MIREVADEAGVRNSFPVMRQLRPHLTEDEYATRVARQQEGGYRLAVVEEDGVCRAAAGFRIIEMLHQGLHLYVDDLVTDEAERSKGHGEALMDWMLAEAKRLGCVTLQLDSGVQRFRAHAFYFDQRMHISGYHFTMEIR
ncbi:MAG: GNAT family N-acetyltransferase [Acidobacteriota bacterium]|nr:GNAT family N-acetyltransferase [Acidobacteriota bacterium]